MLHIVTDFSTSHLFLPFTTLNFNFILHTSACRALVSPEDSSLPSHQTSTVCRMYVEFEPWYLSVCWVRYGLNDWGSIPGRGRDLFSSPQRPDRLWDLKLTTHLYLVSRLKMHGAIPPLPDTSSWLGAYLGKGFCVIVNHFHYQTKQNRISIF